MLTAHDFGAPHLSAPYVFGLTDTRAASALRLLADRIERGDVSVSGVTVSSASSLDDFTKTILTMNLCEKAGT